jgi:PAP2 superfamily
MTRTVIGVGRVLFALWAGVLAGAGLTSPAVMPSSLTPIAEWSREAQRAIVPPPAGVGDKFPGEAAVYIGLVHAAMYDVAVALHDGYRPYAIARTAPADTAPAAAVAAAAHGVLAGLLPAQIADLNTRYAEYLSRVPNNVAKTNGVVLGEQVATEILAMRANDGRTAEIQHAQPRAGRGVFEPDRTRPVLGFRLSRMRPLVLESAIQFRPAAPNPLDSQEYAADFEEVRTLGGLDSDVRTDEQTSRALFWTDHDVGQWNEALLRLAADRRLDLMQTARLLSAAHVSGGDSMIACFDAKYYYMFWRPAAAMLSDPDGRARTESDASWRPLRTTPNHPEYPAAHACHTSAIVEALRTFFGTDAVRVSLDSRTTGTTRTFNSLDAIVREVEDARVFAGLHFRHSTLTGSRLGRDVARFVAARHFRAVAASGRGSTSRQ